MPLFHSLVCPGVIVTPAHTALLFPPHSPGGEEVDGTVQIEVGLRMCSILRISVVDVWEVWGGVFPHVDSIVITR